MIRCSNCKNQFSTRSEKDRHYRVSHTNMITVDKVEYYRNAITMHFECKKCNGSYRDPKNLKEHLKKTQCAKENSLEEDVTEKGTPVVQSMLKSVESPQSHKYSQSLLPLSQHFLTSSISVLQEEIQSMNSDNNTTNRPKERIMSEQFESNLSIESYQDLESRKLIPVQSTQSWENNVSTESSPNLGQTHIASTSKTVSVEFSDDLRISQFDKVGMVAKRMRSAADDNVVTPKQMGKKICSSSEAISSILDTNNSIEMKDANQSLNSSPLQSFTRSPIFKLTANHFSKGKKGSIKGCYEPGTKITSNF